MVSFERGGWNVNVVCIQSKRKHTCLKLKTRRLNFEVFCGKWLMWSMIFTQGAMKISMCAIKGFLACVYYMYLDGTSSRKKRNDLGIKLWIGTHVTSPGNSFRKFDSGYPPKAEAMLLPLLVVSSNFHFIVCTAGEEQMDWSSPNLLICVLWSIIKLGWNIHTGLN